MTVPTRLVRLERSRTALATAPPALQSTDDVLSLIEAAVAETTSDVAASPIERARTYGALAGVALKALEARNLEARVVAIERVLKLRTDR